MLVYVYYSPNCFSTGKPPFHGTDSMTENVRDGPCCGGDVTLLPQIVSGADKRQELHKNAATRTDYLCVRKKKES